MKHALGIDLGGSHLAAGIIAETGEVLSCIREELPRKSAWSVTRQMGKLVQRLTEQSSVKVECIGLGIPGLVNTKEGVVHQSPHFPAWHDVPLRALLANQFDLPFVFQNDANMFAYAELCCGKGKTCDDFIMLTLGSGIGAGIILNKELVTGSLGFAGEVGHMTLDENGPACTCGNHGCWELYAASQAFQQYLQAFPEAQKELPNANSLQDLAQLAEQGSQAALRFWKWYAKKLAIGLHALMNAFGVTEFVLSGSVALAKEFFLEETLQQLRQRSYCYYAKHLHIETAAFSNETGMIGSALYALQHPTLLCKTS